MAVKKLVSPQLRIRLENWEITSGVDVECFSSRLARSDWCKVELSSQLQTILSYQDMEPAQVEMGYEDDYDTLMTGYCRRITDDYWKEILIKDDLIKLERVQIKGTFTYCTPQDIIQYVLVQAGIESYQLDQTDYGKRDAFMVKTQTGIDTINAVNTAWGIQNDFFCRAGVFYWGVLPKQAITYILEESENILSLKKIGELWEIETLGIPWIHHSEEIEVVHSKYSGTVTVEKAIIKTDEKGFTRMYLYFKGA